MNSVDYFNEDKIKKNIHVGFTFLNFLNLLQQNL